MVTIPKKLICKCKGYGECTAGQQFFQRGHTATIFEVQQSGEMDSEMIDVESPL